MSEEPSLPLEGVEKVPRVVKLTPMVAQYLRGKERYPDAILLYRLGDFYARDENLEVLDSYVYRLRPAPDAGTNGTASKRRTQRTGPTSRSRTRTSADAYPAPSSTPG